MRNIGLLSSVTWKSSTNPVRRHSTPGLKSPAEYERILCAAEETATGSASSQGVMETGQHHIKSNSKEATSHGRDNLRLRRQLSPA